jgi:endonuclease YncB( thermonuclease family)
MPFVAIRGTFRADLGVPDGDTVRFIPDDLGRLNQIIRGRRPRPGGQNSIAIRFEGIDALEKDAIKPFSSDATKRNLELIGGNGSRGVILSRQFDGNGRVVSFVFARETLFQDGAEVMLDAVSLQESINFKLLAEGHVYPMFYTTFFAELRSAFVEAVQLARANNRGVWKADATNSGFKFNGPGDLPRLPPIFPKLWRRLQSFSWSNRPLNDFPHFIATLEKEYLMTTPDLRRLSFDHVVEVNGNELRLSYKPEHMLFEPR